MSSPPPAHDPVIPPAPSVPRRSSIILLLALFCILLVSGIWIYVFERLTIERRDELQQAANENSALACAFEEHVRRVIKTSDNALLFLKTEYEKNGCVTGSIRDFVASTSKDTILSQMSVADSSGNLLLSALPTSITINISAREHFIAHQNTDKLGIYIAKPIIMRLSGKATFFLSRRLNNPDGSFGGIVAVGLDPQYFEDYYSIPELGSGRSILLVGLDHIVRVRRFQQSSEVGQDLGSSPVFEKIRHSPTGTYETTSTIDGNHRLSSYRLMKDYPLIVVVARLKALALSSFSKRQTRYLASAAFLTVFIAAFCVMLIQAVQRIRLQATRLRTELAEREKVEEALRESQSLFSLFMENMPSIVFLKDSDDKVLYCNEEFRRVFGKSSVGKSTLELPGPNDEAARKMREDDQRVFREGSLMREETIIDSQGRARIFETHKFRVERGDKPPFLAGISIDITERRQEEKRKQNIERQMQQTQKLESLGVLAGGIAHDFNNLLMAIQGNAEMALYELPPASPARVSLSEIEKASQRAANLCKQMLAYSGKGRFTIQPINLNEIVHEMSNMLDATISKNASLRFNFSGQPPIIMADPSQIAQVVMNLLVNASESLNENGGIITITTGVLDMDRQYIADALFEKELPEGRYAFLNVEDNGCGMDKETQSRIFEPFFSTKFTGRGLGLAATLGIIHGHKGAIRVYSEPGKGSVFRVFFPAHETVAPASEQNTAITPQNHHKRGIVLLIDDEETVRVVGVRMLKSLGYDTITAVDGYEGVEIFRQRHAEIACILLDLTMPRLDGEGAFMEIRRIREDVPVILTSGYSEQEISARFSGSGLAGFIQKPYKLNDLSAKLKAVFG